MSATQSRPALLFDLDGTLLDTDPIHAAVFAELLAEHGMTLAEGDYLDRIHGRLNADIFAELVPGADAEALSDDKEARFRARLDDAVPATPGLEALLDRARRNRWGTAVVTNAPRPNAEAMLAAIGLSDGFNALVIAEECVRGKPHPDPYLGAMAQLGATPSQSIAFEDSPSGLRSARDAGATVIGLRSSLDHAALCAAGAHASITDFNDPALAPYLARLHGEAA